MDVREILNGFNPVREPIVVADEWVPKVASRTGCNMGTGQSSTDINSLSEDWRVMKFYCRMRGVCKDILYFFAVFCVSFFLVPDTYRDEPHFVIS
jgi:hypothetical protein